MADYFYYILFFLAGAGVVSGFLLWAMGPVARTWMLAHVLRQRIIDIPLSDRTKVYKRVGKRQVDEKGNYWLKLGKTMKCFGIDPRWVYLAENRIPTTTLLENVDQNVDATHAKLAEEKGKGGKTTMKIWGQNVSWEALNQQLKSRLGGDFMAGFFGASIAGNHPVDPLKDTKGSILKYALVIIIVFAAIVGLYLAKSQGWF